MMILKFYLVIMWFMHLKFDNSLFMKLFVADWVHEAPRRIRRIALVEIVRDHRGREGRVA